jgi:DNA-binding winged helix-turn-helix (wHTH) protein
VRNAEPLDSRLVQSSVETPARARFEDFELDLQTAELRRSGRVVALERQPATVLVLLVSRAGRLVSRAELQRTVWNDGTNVDFERGLNYCIRQVRRALRDGARVPRFIETVPRRGYRFLATVVMAEAEAAPTSSANRDGRRCARPLTTLVRAFAAAALVVLATGLTHFASAPASLRNREHHAAATAIVRTIHLAVFGPAVGTSAHHSAARTIARAAHDLIF